MIILISKFLSDKQLYGFFFLCAIDVSFIYGGTGYGNASLQDTV